MKPEMPELYVGGMTDRQIRRHNKLIREEAIFRKKLRFMGACRKHGHTMFKLELNNGKISHRCLTCRREAELKKRDSRIKNRADYARKVWNREQLYNALKEGKLQVELVCQHHGLTTFSIESTSKKTYCRICHRARVYRNRNKSARSS